MKTVLLLVATLLPMLTEAAIYRCNVAGGKTEYQATPCQVGSAKSIRTESGQPSDEGAAFPPQTDNQEPKIVGDAAFQTRVSEALSLLRLRDVRAYDIVAGYVGRIEQAPRSGMKADSDPPTFLMSSASAMFSVSWAAASIAHDAYHSKLYFDYRGAHPGNAVPADAWGGTFAEAKCTKFQVAAMRKIGAPQSEIDHALINMDGHYIGQDMSTRKYHKAWSCRVSSRRMA